MAYRFNTAAAIKATIKGILQLERLPITLCTDSKSLYNCLVKLGTTQEKRLIVDLMCLQQSYERREIAEIKWIDRNSNPADAMTKSKPCQALKDLIDTNTVNLQVTEWVERVGDKDRGYIKNPKTKCPQCLINDAKGGMRKRDMVSPLHGHGLGMVLGCIATGGGMT